MLTWKKLGHVYVPAGDRWWARSYAAFPTVHALDGGRLRIYFTALDEERRGRTGFVDVHESRPTEVLASSDEPVLGLGNIGLFDDSGANAFSALSHRGRQLLFYQGWQRTELIPYLIFTGLAASQDGVSFHKQGRIPILDRTEREPFLRGSPCVLESDGGLRMWYVSAIRWTSVATGPRYYVVIRHATSPDGIFWEADPEPCLEPQGHSEYAVGRPWVLHAGGMYRMWFSIRSLTEPYRLGYAESRDGVHWERLDRASLPGRSSKGWDAEMVCYACVYHRSGRLLMFYNGNSHGASGFGCAEAVADW